MRYVFIDRNIALEKGLITENSVCRTNGTEVILTEDEVSRLGKVDDVVNEAGGRIMTLKEALKELEKKEYNV